MRQALIIADDLSGATDSGIAFAKAGLSTLVVLKSGASEFAADVLSVDADSRRLSPAQAAEEVSRLARECSHPDQLVFKKLDSTLRGNVAVELRAILEAARELHAGARNDREPVLAVMAPAFPAQGRTTMHGRQLVKGKRLEDVEIWKDQLTPAGSHIPTLLEAAGMRALALGLDVVRSSAGQLGSAMLELSAKTDVVVCDAETDEDLRAIAEAGVALGPHVVWAGSAGLAYHLPQAAGLAGTVRSVSPESFASGPTLFVVGTVSNAAREQVKMLASSAGVVALNIPPSELLAGVKSPMRRAYELALGKALEAGNDVLVVLSPEGDEGNHGSRVKLEKADGKMLASSLAQLIAPYAASVGGLVATGGETARAVLQAWNIFALRLVGELEPGVPFSVAENWDRHLPVLTKAGDFGDAETLVRCRKFLHRLARVSDATLGQEEGL